MHTRTAILSTIALVATGFPLALGVPVGGPDGSLEIREPSVTTSGGFGAFQGRDATSELESRARGKNLVSNKPAKTTAPQLSVVLTSKSKADLRALLASEKKGATIFVQGVSFEYGDDLVTITDVGKDPQQYTVSAAKKLAKAGKKRELDFTRDLNSENLAAFQPLDEITELHATKPPIGHRMSNGKPIKTTESSVIQLTQ